MATTQEELNKAVLMVRQIDAHLKAFEKEYNDVTNGLQGGIDDESKDEIELWKPKLEPALKDIDKTSTLVRRPSIPRASSTRTRPS